MVIVGNGSKGKNRVVEELAWKKDKKVKVI